MSYPLVICNKKYVYIFKSRWTLMPLCFSKEEIKEWIERDDVHE